uniref:Uncharacterized protein n=1 Tax=Panagrolaimus sp. JU765 TaxID=591449 RepID=A0AC34QTX0_9BILA
MVTEDEKRKLNAEIIRLKNKLKTHESEFNETLKAITTLTEENQQLKRKNNEKDQTINNLQMEIASLLDFTDLLTKVDDNEIMKTIWDKKVEASRKLAQWTEAMKMKKPFIKPEQKASYYYALECLKFMTKKHGSTLNTSELTTDIQQLTKEEFTDAIDNFVKTCEDSGELLQKCKEIVEVLESE